VIEVSECGPECIAAVGQVEEPNPPGHPSGFQSRQGLRTNADSHTGSRLRLSKAASLPTTSNHRMSHESLAGKHT